MSPSGEEDPAAEEPQTLAREDEPHILQDLQAGLLKGNLNDSIERRLFETQKEYFTVYMEKLMCKIPMGQDLVKIIRNGEGSNGFEYTFTAAKSMIQSQMRVKQIRAFHAVFDMVYGLMWRYVHEKVVSPALRSVLSDEKLNLAYEKYQCCSKTEEEGSVVEMQCLLYCIQEVIENQEPVKIPNPLYSRFTQQMKAMSEYVIALLVSLSKPGRVPADSSRPRETEREGSPDPDAEQAEETSEGAPDAKEWEEVPRDAKFGAKRKSNGEKSETKKVKRVNFDENETFFWNEGD